MIQITPQMRILVAVEPVDFRKGIDGLAALCRQALIPVNCMGFFSRVFAVNTCKNCIACDILSGG
jgi:hypothetical protein